MCCSVHCTLLYSTVLYCTILYCTVLTWDLLWAELRFRVSERPSCTCNYILCSGPSWLHVPIEYIYLPHPYTFSTPVLQIPRPNPAVCGESAAVPLFGQTSAAGPTTSDGPCPGRPAETTCTLQYSWLVIARGLDCRVLRQTRGSLYAVRCTPSRR